MRYIALFAGAAIDIWTCNHARPSILAFGVGMAGGMVLIYGVLDFCRDMITRAEADWDAHDAIERARRRRRH
jgi:hypothetical protein